MTSDQDKVVDVAEVGDGSGGDDGEWEDILGTGALLKKVLAAGDADGVRPMRGCIADITVSCTVNDKNLMEEERTQFQIGEGERHTAWDIAVPLMVKGEHALIKTEKRFVSFDKEDLGDEPEIVFDIQLHSFEETTPDDLMTTEQRIEFATKKRTQGRAKFEQGDLHSALACYQRALSVLTSSRDSDAMPEEEELRNTCVPFWNNIALIFVKLNKHALARDKCDLVLSVDKDNAKALFRKAQALLGLKQFDAAREVAEQGLPQNKKLFAPLLHRARMEQQRDREQQAEMYKRMMGSALDPSKPGNGDDEDEDDGEEMDEAALEEWRKGHLMRGLTWAAVAAVCAILIRYLLS